MADDAILAQRAQIEQEIAGRTVCDLLQDNADRHGEAPAACWRDGGTWHTLSWREYRQRVLEGAGELTGWEGLLGWDELLARGRDALAADPDLAGRLRGRVRPEDPVTLVYTSGTIGP